MRFIGLDVHKDLCEVAVVEGDACWSGPRVRSTPEDLEVFGQSLGPEDQVVLEATGGALAIARILERYAGRVVMANPIAVRAIAAAKAKTDRLDARTLAKLLAAGFLPSVWLGDERTRLLRRPVSRHAQLHQAAYPGQEPDPRRAPAHLDGAPSSERTCSVSAAAPGSVTRSSLPTSARPSRPASATSSS